MSCAGQRSPSSSDTAAADREAPPPLPLPAPPLALNAAPSRSRSRPHSASSCRMPPCCAELEDGEEVGAEADAAEEAEVPAPAPDRRRKKGSVLEGTAKGTIPVSMMKSTTPSDHASALAPEKGSPAKTCGAIVCRLPGLFTGSAHHPASSAGGEDACAAEAQVDEDEEEEAEGEDDEEEEAEAEAEAEEEAGEEADDVAPGLNTFAN